MFVTNRPMNCKIVKKNLVFQFTDVGKGEYILGVSNLCNWKWETNTVSNSLIIE